MVVVPSEVRALPLGVAGRTWPLYTAFFLSSPALYYVILKSGPSRVQIWLLRGLGR